MSKLFKKIALSFAVLAVSVCLVGPANAQTATDLQAQINALLTQLAALQAQLGTGTTTGTTITGCPAFTRNLTIGSTGADVKCLQQFLNANGALVSATGAGSPGNETTYFGSRTKAALAVYQAANAISPAVGYFGPITRANVNPKLAGTGAGTGTGTLPTGCTSTTGYSPVTGQPCSTGGTVTTTPAGAVSVYLDSSTPISATIISDTTSEVAGSQALIPAMALNFSTSYGTTAKVKTLVLKRVGISSDSDADNIYLYDGATRIAEMTSVSLGVVTFTNADGLFTVSGNKVITVKFDLNKDTSSGKTIGFQVVAATNIVTDGAAVMGTFPISGNLMTTAGVTDFGRLQVVKAITSASVDPGTTGFEAMKLTLTAANQNIKVYKIRLLMLGSANLTDLSNMALYDGATLLTTVASIASDRTVTFDLSANPLTVTSVKNLSLRVDVIGGSTRTISFSLQRASDVEAMDANYNVYVKVDTGTVGSFTVQTSTECTVASGSIIVTKATDSPSGNIPLAGTNIPLAKYTLQAVGEAIKVSSIEYGVTLAGGPTTIKNVRVYYDGAQVGVTDSSVTSSAQDAAGTEITTNFTVPVGIVKTLEIRADIDEASGNAMENADTIQAYLDEVTDNGQRVVSLGTVNVPSTYKAGNLLTISASALTGVKNTSVGAVTVVQGATNQRIASFLLTSGASEGVDVSSIVFEDGKTDDTTDGTQALGKAFNNIKLMSGSTQIAPTKVTSSSDAATVQYTFYPSPALSIAAGTTVQIDMYADISSSANADWTDPEAVQLDSATGTGKITSSAANIATADSVKGQPITVETGGTISVALDSSSPISQQIKGGATDQALAAFRFSANSVEDLTLTTIAVTSNSTAGSPNVRNLRLFVGGAQVGTATSLVTNVAWFRDLAINIPKSGNTVVTVKGDITPYAEGESVGNYIVLTVATPATITGATTDTISAKGATSGAFATPSPVSTTYYGNAIYPYRTTLTANLTTTKAATGNTRSSSDTIAKLALTGTSAADAQFTAALKNACAADPTETTTPAGLADGEVTVTTTATDFITTSGLMIKNTGDYAIDEGFTYDAGAASVLNTYSKVSFWFKADTVDGNALPADDVAFIVSESAVDGTDASEDDFNLTGTYTDNTWYFITLDLSSVDAADRYYGLNILDSTELDLNDEIFIDQISFYNDYIDVDIAGSLQGSVDDALPNGTTVTFKLSGTTYATGEFYSTSSLAAGSVSGTVRMIPDSEMSLGATTSTYDMITNTTSLMEEDTTSNESLSVSVDAGSVSMSSGTPTVTAGDLTWYDQAVTATAPITWINPSGTTYSVSMGY